MDKITSQRFSRSAALLMAAAAIAPLTTSVYGQGLAQRELARRMALVTDADAALEAGRAAYADQDYETAVSEYRRALQTLPYAPMTENRRNEYLAHLGDASVALSQEYRTVGKYDEARNLLEEVTAPDADPDNQLALQELEYLDDPIRINAALTFEHTQDVDRVRRLLYTGEGYFNLGDFDRAELTFQEVLRVDKYNSAARRWMERVSNVKMDYYAAAYDQTRAKLLADVDAAWELSVPADQPNFGPGPNSETTTNSGTSISNKLKTIILDSVVLEDVTVAEAIDYLRQRSFELDTISDPSQRGVNFVIQKGAGGGDAGGDLGLTAGPDVGEIRIPELKLRNVPIEFALRQITDLAKLRYKIDEFAVTIAPRGTGDIDNLISRTFPIPPDFRALLGVGGGGGGAAVDDDPFREDAAGGGIAPNASVQALLSGAGVSFPEGSNASVVGGGNLVVLNTPVNLDLIQEIVEGVRNQGPKQIMISTKFVEVSQENTDELGFDWLISPFGIGGGLGSDALTLGGGTVGSGRSIVDMDSALSGVTSGNRSGDFAVNRNSIDAILDNPTRTAQVSNAAPGILSLTGLFSGRQVQLIMRGLQQKRGTDIMTAPSVLARSGQQAKIEIVREFIYPTEYEPPEVPNEVIGAFVVTPSTPTAFETRNTGVTLEIEPTIGNNNYTIDLRFVPEIVEFEGFVNYGSPIFGVGAGSTDMLGGGGGSEQILITDNRIEQPVFSARRVNTGLTIYDGHTVAVGGLMREDVQNVEDSVPILGDIPVIGRLFQSKTENRIKSNLIIFVTADIIDPTGRPIRGVEAANSSSFEALGAGVLPPLPN